LPLIYAQAKSRRHRSGDYPAMAANKDGGSTMTIGYFAKSFSNPMTEARSTVTPRNNRRKGVPLLEISQIISISDLFPGETIGFPQFEFLQTGMNVYFEI
jgi:hypothetical protein